MQVAVDHEGSTISSENPDYVPSIAEHYTTASDGEAGNNEPEKDPDLAYASIKAMGYADHEVSSFSSLLIVQPEILTLIRPLAGILICIILLIFPQYLLRITITLIPTLVQKKCVTFSKSVSKCHCSLDFLSH